MCVKGNANPELDELLFHGPSMSTESNLSPQFHYEIEEEGSGSGNEDRISIAPVITQSDAQEHSNTVLIGIADGSGGRPGGGPAARWSVPEQSNWRKTPLIHIQRRLGKKS